MSFILDALKKSESERLRRSTPGIADVPDGTRSRGAPRWSWLLGALLAVNAAVLGSLWLRPATDPVPVPSPTPTAADAGGRSFAALVAAARESQPPPRANETPAAAQEPPSAAGDTRAAAPQAHLANTASAAGPQAGMPIPTFNELRARGTLQLPDLHLDIHVYSDKPAQRFVFVNMRKYREQGKLDEGPLVREITADGVILEFSGAQFLLPRE